MPVGGENTINAVGLLFLVVMGLLLVSLPRRSALLPVIMTVCYMTMGQRVVFGGLHFSIMRLLVVFGWIRLIIRGELHRFPLKSVDKLVLAWQTSSIIMYTLQLGTGEAFIYISGGAYDVVGMYFLIRFLMKKHEELLDITRIFAIAIVPLALLMAVEHYTHHNSFSMLGGGISADTFLDDDGRIRCMGPFRHPILAGTFGATLMPFFLGLWFQERRNRLVAGAGLVAAVTIVLTAQSSGPVVACLFVTIGTVLWLYRGHMRLVWWSLVCGLAACHIVMKAPVWFLMSRLGSLIGGSGDHRAMLMDAAIRHFDEWWLMGTHYTAHWMPYHLRADPTMVDMTSQFVYEGVTGGLLTLALFAVLLAVAFKAVGKLIRSTEGAAPFEYRIMIWSLGVGLLAHTISLISVVYFDQNEVDLLLVLGAIALCASERAVYESEKLDQDAEESGHAIERTAANL